MRGRVGIALLLAGVCFWPAATPAGGVGVPPPQCRAFTVVGGDPHASVFSVRCNFAINRIEMRPSSAVTRARAQTTLHGEVDQGDEVTCRATRKHSRVTCHGRAGARVRIAGGFLTDDAVDTCGVKTAFEVSGGLDCNGEVCPAIALQWDKPARPPRNCTSS